MALYVGCTTYLSKCVSVRLNVSEVAKLYQKPNETHSLEINRVPFHMRPIYQISTAESTVRF